MLEGRASEKALPVPSDAEPACSTVGEPTAVTVKLMFRPATSPTQSSRLTVPESNEAAEIALIPAKVVFAGAGAIQSGSTPAFAVFAFRNPYAQLLVPDLYVANT